MKFIDLILSEHRCYTTKMTKLAQNLTYKIDTATFNITKEMISFFSQISEPAATHLKDKFDLCWYLPEPVDH